VRDEVSDGLTATESKLLTAKKRSHNADDVDDLTQNNKKARALLSGVRSKDNNDEILHDDDAAAKIVRKEVWSGCVSVQFNMRSLNSSAQQSYFTPVR
jgi:hypothetical protein